MKIVLINPRFPESFWSFKWAIDRLDDRVRTLNPPLGLATLAALCPSDWEVEIVDENVETIPLDPEADIVGVCGMGVQHQRQKELLTYYRERGYYTVAGGSYASLCPEAYDGIADTVVSGESEYIWPEFCADFIAGSPRPRYRESGTVSLEDSPTPRFDLIKTERYGTMSLQFSRGCPYRCEFCDIIVMFGRKPRTKSVEQVRQELDALRRENVHDVFFVDDNLIGDKKAAKRLLAFLRDYQREHDYRFNFGTEASLNLSREEEMMRLMREANFEWVFIGIESPDADSLKETKKFQNTRGDILTSVQTIYHNGIDILAGFIVGFDNDTMETFEQQYRFITDSGIQSAMIGMLVAIEKTPLYERLEGENRLRPQEVADNSKLATNVIPKQMTYDDMVKGYRRLHDRLLEHRNISRRIRNKLRHFASEPYLRQRTSGQTLSILSRIIGKVWEQEGAGGIAQFVRSMPLRRPRLIPFAVHDWAIGLSMRDYVERHFHHSRDEHRQAARRYLENMRSSLQRYVRSGKLAVSFDELKDTQPRFSLSIRGPVGRPVYTRVADQLERMLGGTHALLTLRIEVLDESDAEALRGMLDRLRKFGDRIVIAADAQTRRILDIDSSVFTLSMAQST